MSKFSLRRKYVLIAIGFVGLLALIIVTRGINGNKPSADAVDMMGQCDENQEDCTIDLIVVNVNPSEGSAQQHNIIAYNSEGKTVVSGSATLAANTWSMIGDPSVVAKGNVGRQGTPLGLYARGKVWSSGQDDPDGYPYHDGVSDTYMFGSLFIELSGKPVDGGINLCGLNDGDDCRHIGIHSSATEKLQCSTFGCVKINDDLVRRIAKFSGEGTPVLVTDEVLAGNVMPVDPESYDNNYDNPKKVEKEYFSSSVSVAGDSVGVVHKYHNFWISETPKPTGPYIITASAAGYLSNSSKVEYKREEKDGIITNIEKIGATDIIVGLPADLMYSSYFGVHYGNGYENKQLRMSTWDTAITNIILPDKDTGEFKLNINQGYPECGEVTENNTDGLIQPFASPWCDPAVLSKFAVYANVGAWHDLGYGAYFRSPLPGVKIAEFTYTYGSNKESEILVKANLSALDDNQLRSMMVWGITLKQEQKIGHSLNDYIYFYDSIQNYEDHMNLNQIEDAIMQGRGDNTELIDGYPGANTGGVLPAETSLSQYTGIYTPFAESFAESDISLFEPAQREQSAWWDPINLMNTAQDLNYTNQVNIETNDGMMQIEPVTPEKYENWYDYLNPMMWFAPDPLPEQMFMY